jgi:hypothetical protein
MTNLKKENEEYKNFYKLFNDNEQKAISTLFKSEEDLNSFKQKITILENRNINAEKRFIKEIKDLKKMINEKDEQIKKLNEKIHEYEIKYKILQNESKEKLNTFNQHILTPKEKKTTVEQQLKEFGYIRNIRNKNEKIEKLNCIINNLKEEINKNHIEKNKEKELNEFKNEIGKIEIFDLKNILPNIKRSNKQSSLVIKKKEIQISIQGKKKKVTYRYEKSNGKDNQKTYSIYSGNKKNSNSLNKNNNNKVNGNISLTLSRGRKK